MNDGLLMRIARLLIVFLTLTVFANGEGLEGKVMCGYQGWFRVPDDGSENGWHHYAPGRTFEPGKCNIDLWPDVRELPAADRFPTQISVYCDICYITVTHDYIVTEDMSRGGAREVARAHLRKFGWQCNYFGDRCPEHGENF